MLKNSFLRNIIPHLIPFITFLILACIYFSPSLSGKTLAQNDVIQSKGAMQEANTYFKETGQDVLWSNSAFGGMPVWLTFQSNIIGYFHQLITAILPVTILLSVLAYLSFYLLMLSFRADPWVSFIGGVAFAFSSFTIISIEAGHINKVFNIVLMPGVFAGVVYTFRKNYWTGLAITAFFSALQIYYGHVQITYYLIYIIAFYIIGQFICHLMEKRISDFIKASSLLLIAVIIAIAPNISKLWTMAEFSKSTTRGGSELASPENKGGLDKEYALGWSNGRLELFTILVPSFYGGSSHEALSTNSDSYSALIEQGASTAQAKSYLKSMPLYWGDQPFTSGPVYFGAIICFLFALGLFVVKGNVKWALLLVTILSLLLSMGSNLEPVTDFFFYNVPLYNKFRSVTMILSIAELTVPLLGCIALVKIFRPDEQINKEELITNIKYATIITGGICLLLALLGNVIFDFKTEADKQLPDWLSQSLVSDRASVLRSDAFRSLILILISAGLLWAFVANKLKQTYVYIGLAFLVTIDLWFVDKRYLDNEDFKTVKKNFDKKVFVATPADEIILQDKDPDFRVLNLTQNPFTEAYTSFFHKSIGGYSGIKLARYQDMIENHLSKNNLKVLNMLNTKYFILEDKNTNQPQVQRNPEALGHAWLVSSYKLVNTPKEEIDTLKSFDPSKEAIVDKVFEKELNGLKIEDDSSASIVLESYHPDKLKYKSNLGKKGLAVFSEIYYQPGWNAYIDGKLTPHFRVNYILRGMVLPEGKHEIEFRFEPTSIKAGEKISLAGSAILLLFIGFAFFKGYKSDKEDN